MCSPSLSGGAFNSGESGNRASLVVNWTVAAGDHEKLGAEKAVHLMHLSRVHKWHVINFEWFHL